jgi:hypothetical protein
LELEVALIDKGVGPDTRHELFLADHLTGALDQRDQNFEGAAAEDERVCRLPAAAVVPEAGGRGMPS